MIPMSRNRRRIALALAAGAVPFAHFLKPEGEGGGAAAPEKKPGEKKPDDQPRKIEMTEEELDARLKSHAEMLLTKERDAAAKKAQADKDEAERIKAEKDGEFKTLAEKDRQAREKAEQERDAAKLDTRRLAVKDQLRDYLAEKHPAHATAAKWIMPAIDFDLKTEDAEIGKRIAKAADEYVKDNPRQTGGGGAPGSIGRGQRASEGEKPKNDEAANGKDRPLSRPARMAF
jgi:hypothetical protein